MFVRCKLAKVRLNSSFICNVEENTPLMFQILAELLSLG